MIKVGQKVRFVPLDGIKFLYSTEACTAPVTGVIVYINQRHGWFSAEYCLHGVKFRRSFKFCDVGRDVRICG